MHYNFPKESTQYFPNLFDHETHFSHNISWEYCAMEAVLGRATQNYFQGPFKLLKYIAFLKLKTELLNI